LPLFLNFALEYALHTRKSRGNGIECDISALDVNLFGEDRNTNKERKRLLQA
jgi:hypothetical protein